MIVPNVAAMIVVQTPASCTDSLFEQHFHILFCFMLHLLISVHIPETEAEHFHILNLLKSNFTY